MPTMRPRYTVTDVGPLADMLDVAQRRWPEEPRKALLLRLATIGHASVALELENDEDEKRRERQQAALAGIGDLVNREMLLGDTAWQ